MTDDAKPESLVDVDGDDVCMVEEQELAVVDAFDGFYHQLAAVNTVVNELKDAALQRDVTALLLAKANLEWDLLDARLGFLASISRNGAHVRRTPALNEAFARLRRVLQGGFVYRRDSGTAGDLLAQSGRLAERLRKYERPVDGPPSPSPRKRGGRRHRRGGAGCMSCPRFGHCLLARLARAARGRHG